MILLSLFAIGFLMGLMVDAFSWHEETEPVLVLAKYTDGYTPTLKVVSSDDRIDSNVKCCTAKFDSIQLHDIINVTFRRGNVIGTRADYRVAC